MAARSLLLLGILVAIMLVCLEVADPQELTETNASGKNVGGGGALGIGYGQPGFFGGRGGVGYQNAYGGGSEPRYDSGYGRGYEPRYGGRRSGYHRYGGRQGSGFGRNGDQVGRYNGGYNCSVGYRAGRN